MATSRGGNLLHTKAEKPLRIFISYGHPEAEICLRSQQIVCPFIQIKVDVDSLHASK